MAGRKINIYAGESIEKLIEFFGVLDDCKRKNPKTGEMTPSVSPVVNLVGDQFLALLENTTPALAVCEWMTIVSSYTGHALGSDFARECHFLPWQVQDAIRLDGVGRTFDIDGDNFVLKLQAYSFAERLCIINIVRRWWAMSDEDFGSDRARLEAAGAKVREED